MKNLGNIGDRIESTGQEFDPVVHEISVMRQIILERVHPFDLLRELVSNAAAKEVGATEILIKYTVDDAGHVFEVKDNGCGMNYTGDKGMMAGRLDRFFGLGLSSIVGMKGDEFAWKGLGSKLAYNSCKLEIDTTCGNGQAHRVEINEPWSTIERNLKPKPTIFHYQNDSGTPSLYPRVICWDIGSSPKMRIKPTDKAYKVIAESKEFQVHVFCIRKMDGVQVVTKSQLE